MAFFKRERPSPRSQIPPHLEARFAYINGLQHAEPPPPWHRTGIVPVGGLWHVGFGSNSDLALVISVSGRGVIDCTTGQKLARDDEEYHPNEGSLDADGIGPLQDQKIRIAGIWGGGLTRLTADGWSVEPHPLSWPNEELLLCPPGQTMLWQPNDQEPNLIKLGNFASSLVAYGFSPTGRSLIIATSSEFIIYGRE